MSSTRAAAPGAQAPPSCLIAPPSPYTPPSEPGTVHGRAADARPHHRRRPAGWILVIAVTALVGAATVSAATVDSDTGSDLLAQSRTLALALARLRWQFTAAVTALAALHYLASAVAAGIRLSLPETQSPAHYGHVTRQEQRDAAIGSRAA